MTETPAKFVCVGLYFCYFIFSSYWATEMAPPEKPEQVRIGYRVITHDNLQALYRPH